MRLLNLSSFRKKTSGRAVVVSDGESVRFVTGRPASAGRPLITAFGESRLGGGGLGAALKAAGLRGERHGITVLGEGEYTFLAADAPDVPAQELNGAMQWRLKELVDFPVDQARVDCLEIPGATGRGKSVFAAVARLDVLRRRVAEYDEAGFALSAIDVRETAQRNIASLYEEEDRGVALLYFDATGGLMTLSARGELYHVRRFEATHDAIIAAVDDRAREELFGRIVLEIQRTFDHFERQFKSVSLTRLMVGPEPRESGLVDYLRTNLAVAVEAVALDQVLDFLTDAAPDRRQQWRLFHLFGTSLRNGADA